MKKFLSALLAGTMMLSMLTACSGGTGSSSKQPNDDGSKDNYPTAENPITIKLGYSAPPNAIADGNFHMYADAVTEATGGAVQFELYPNSQLGNEKVMLEGVMGGTLEAAALSGNTLATAIPEMNALCLPFLIPSYQDYWKITANEEFRDGLNKVLVPAGITLVTGSTTAPRAITSMKPIRTPEDFKGKKIRVMDGNIYTDIFETFGSGTTTIPFPECYASLQQGVIDGLDVDLGMSVSMKFFEVAKYHTDLYHTFHSTLMVMNNEILGKLSPEQQQILMDSASVIWDSGIERMEEDFAKRKEQAVEMGVEFINLTPEEREVFRQASAPIYDKYKDIIGEEFYNWYMDFVESKIS